jgi:hemerythrin superfamily protein
MSLLDKAIAAVTPPVSNEKRAEARAKARSAAEPGDWLSQILDHHQQIEAAFAETKAAESAGARRAAQKRLAELLTGHSMAEEGVIYPALAHAGKQGHANTAYTEQAAAKMQLAALEHLDPVSQDYLDKLGHLEGAVATHVYQEENDWFIDLKENAPAADQQQASARYAEEFGRYMSGGQDPTSTLIESESRSWDTGAPMRPEA